MYLLVRLTPDSVNTLLLPILCLILESVDESYLNQLLCWLTDGDFLIPYFFLYLPVGIVLKGRVFLSPVFILPFTPLHSRIPDLCNR